MIRSLHISLWCATIFTPVVLLSFGLVLAQTMTGSFYQIESDSINMGGGFSESDSFTMEDTLGEVATGISESDSFELRAGYQQMQSAFISMTQPDSIVLDPNLPGLGGGTSNASTSVVVTTDSPAGYELLISASANPAMQNEFSDSIADYAPSSGDPDFTFTVGSEDAAFGFSVESIDALARFLHNGSVCDAGSTNTAQTCWDGLSTTPTAIVSGNTANHPTGTQTTLYFRVGMGVGVSQPPGTYVATTTVTAIPL